MKKERLVQCYGLYGVTAELAEVCTPADLKPVKKVEKHFVQAIATEFVETRLSNFGYPDDYLRPVAMKVRIGDIKRSTYLDCYRTSAERAHRARGAILAFPDDNDAHWRSFSWYGKKWCGNTRVTFDFAIHSIEKEAQRAAEGKREPLTEVELRLLMAAHEWQNQVKTLVEQLAARREADGLAAGKARQDRLILVGAA